MSSCDIMWWEVLFCILIIYYNTSGCLQVHDWTSILFQSPVQEHSDVSMTCSYYKIIQLANTNHVHVSYYKQVDGHDKVFWVFKLVHSKTAYNGPHPNSEIKLEKEKITSVHYKSLYGEAHQLTLHDVERQDSGNYSCSVIIHHPYYHTTQHHFLSGRKILQVTGKFSNVTRHLT